MIAFPYSYFNNLFHRSHSEDNKLWLGKAVTILVFSAQLFCNGGSIHNYSLFPLAPKHRMMINLNDDIDVVFSTKPKENQFDLRSSLYIVW